MVRFYVSGDYGLECVGGVEVIPFWVLDWLG